VTAAGLVEEPKKPWVSNWIHEMVWL
jgi:hypothetical protein